MISHRKAPGFSPTVKETPVIPDADSFVSDQVRAQSDLATRRTAAGREKVDDDKSINGQENREKFWPSRSENRFAAHIPMRVFGIDASNHAFSESIRARNISDHGAEFTGLTKRLRPGDIIGVSVGNKKVRCNVIWVQDSGELNKIDIGINLPEDQLPPWQEEIEAQRVLANAPGTENLAGVGEKRRFQRLRLPISIEIRSEKGDGPPMRAETADIAGRGCYIETILPVPVRTILNLTFWLNDEKICTRAIVRTCDNGLGMGIEFTGLDEATQQRLQTHFETIAGEASNK